MKKIFLFILLIISVSGFSQSLPGYTNISEKYRHLGLAPLGLNVPAGAAPALTSTQTRISGAVFVDTVGGGQGLHYYLGGAWYHALDSATIAGMVSVGGGGGGGLSGGNLGSGLRIYSPPSQGTRTLFYSNGVTADSTSNSNGITFKADTSFLATNKFGYGAWVSTTFPGSSLPTGWTKFSYSGSSVSNGLVLPASGAALTTNFVYMNSNYSASQNYTQYSRVILTTLPAVPADGLGIGKRSANTSAQTQNYVMIRTISGTSIKGVLYTLYGSTPTAQDSTSTMAVQVGDTIDVYSSWGQTHAYVKITKVHGATSAADTTVATYFKYATLAASLQQPPNTGSVWMAGVGATGNYKVINYIENHYDVIGPDIIFAGNSIGTRFDASNLPSHWTRLAMGRSKKTWFTLAGGGDRFIDLALRKDEIVNYRPKYVIIEMGTNDNASDIRTYGAPFLDTLIAHNIEPIILKLFNVTAKDTVMYNICRASERTIFGHKVRIVDAGRSNISVPNNSQHPTDAGNQVISYLLQSEIPDVIGYTGDNELNSPEIIVTKDVTQATNFTNDRILITASGKLSEDQNLKWTPATGGICLRCTGTITSAQNSVDVATGGVTIRDFTSHSSGLAMDLGYFSGGGYGILRVYNPTTTTYFPLYIGDKTYFTAAGKIGLNSQTSPTAWLHLPAVTTSASSAPIKLASGTLMSSIEDGAIEYASSHLYFSIGSTRYQLDQQSTGMTNPMTTTGDMIYSSSGSTPARLAIGTNGYFLKVVAGVPAWADLSTTVTSGSFTPTITNTTNVASSTGARGIYTRSINVVDCTVTVQITPTASSTVTSFSVDIPISSDFTSGLEGVGNSQADGADSNHLIFNTTSDKPTATFTSTGTTGVWVTLHFKYTVQ